jgi:serine/threonine-protein kinase
MTSSDGKQTGASKAAVGMWPRRRRTRRALLPQVLELFAILGFLVLAYHAMFWYWQYTAPMTIEVPDVVSLTEEEAIRVVDAGGLRVRVVGSKADEEIPDGSVLASEPPAGRQVKAGRIVRLTLSSGSRWSVVPDVREMSVDRARALLRQAKLTIGQESARYDDRVPIGYVVGHAPKPDQKVPRGTIVDLWVSKGQAPEIDLIGDHVDSAEERSTQIGYTVPPGATLQEVRIVVRDERGEQTVYRQFHRPGERVTQIVSGKGPEIVVRVFLSGLLVREKTI